MSEKVGKSKHRNLNFKNRLYYNMSEKVGKSKRGESIIVVGEDYNMSEKVGKSKLEGNGYNRSRRL